MHIANDCLLFIIIAGMQLMISNPIIEDESNFTKSTSVTKLIPLNFDWTYEKGNDEEEEDRLRSTTPAASESSMAPIIVVNSPDADAEDVTITHECHL